MIGLKFRPSVCDFVDIRGLPKVGFLYQEFSVLIASQFNLDLKS